MRNRINTYKVFPFFLSMTIMTFYMLCLIIGFFSLVHFFFI